MSDARTYPNYINGEWVGRDAAFENRNPADTGEIVGLFAKGSPAHGPAPTQGDENLWVFNGAAH